MSQVRQVRGRRRHAALVVGTTVAFISALGVAGLADGNALATPAQAAPSPAVLMPAADGDDDRDSVARKQADSAQHIDDLTSQLEGIDSSLAQVYVDLERLNGQIPGAEAQLKSAQQAFEAADRQHQLALDQLDSAEAEQSRIAREIDEAEKQQDEANQAIGALAREMYRGDMSSPELLALTSQGTGEIGDRAAAADTLTRSQTRALNEALALKARQENQAQRQEAVTERIANLEQTARQASEQARTSKEEADKHLSELTAMKSDRDQKKKEWESQKKTAQSQLTKWQEEFDAMSAKLAEIDAANRAAAAQQAASSGNFAPAGSMFTSPLHIPLQITSPFGWRHHPILGVDRYHNGTDFAAPCGSPQYPIAPGTVVAAQQETAGGNVLYINHGMINGHSWVSAHVHLSSFAVPVGAHVDRSTVVGYTGATGYATGCHLHLSLMQDGVDVDPTDFL